MAETQPFDEYLASIAASTTGVSMVPGLNGGGDVVALEADAFQISRATEGNFWTVGSDEPFIHRMRDRVFIGNAVGMGPTRSNTNTTWVPDTDTGANWIPRDSQFCVMQDRGVIAISGGSRVSDGAGTASTSAIGVAGFVINDASTAEAAWALYADVQHEAVDFSNSYGLEIAAKDKTAQNFSANPYDRTSGVFGLWLHGGGDPAYGGAPAHPSNTGIMFVKNNASLIASGWNVGISFDDESLTYVSGVAPAIRMAEGHAIEWWASDGLAARIYSTVGAAASRVYQVFDDNNVYFYGANDKPIARVIGGTSFINNVQIWGAATASPVSITAAGDDTNVGLQLRPKGTGAVFMTGGGGSIRIRANDTGIGFFSATPVAQKTGWGVATGTATRTTFATGSVTLPELAERVKALIDDLHSTAGYGLITT